MHEHVVVEKSKKRCWYTYLLPDVKWTTPYCWKYSTFIYLTKWQHDSSKTYFNFLNADLQYIVRAFYQNLYTCFLSLFFFYIITIKRCFLSEHDPLMPSSNCKFKFSPFCLLFKGRYMALNIALYCYMWNLMNTKIV